MNSSGNSSKPGRGRLLEKSMTLLGWELIRQSLSRSVVSPATEPLCHGLAPANDRESTERLLKETAEMVSLLESGENFPINPFDDIRPILITAGERLLIEPLHGLSLLKLLRVARALKRTLEKKSGHPLLNEMAVRLNPLADFIKELDRCIDEEGEIKENASRELKQAIHEVRAAKQKLENQVRKLLSASEYKDAVQDSYFTEREGRVVIPLKADFRSRIGGIVHDSSGSGQTLFVEPTQIVPLNNQLKINKFRVEQEKIKILESLARQTVEHGGALEENLEVLTGLDLIHARAQLARSMNAVLCPLNEDGRMNLKQARNPELVLSHQQEIVPNDIAWDKSVRVIIISGPNTGGKTVTLKTVGLMSLMARSGLFLPVEEGSTIGFFPEVYADIGDDQNIQLSLSTFSAHLQKIIHILEHAVPGALILLDELGIATDPLEGASLAEAVLKKMKRKNMMILVSTHYLSLKTLAQTQEGFENACTEFDRESLAPTYRLIFGIPGQSAALDTAERLGLHPDIIHNAREIYQEKDSRADGFLQDLTNQRLDLEREKELLKQKTEEMEKLAREQNILTQRIREEEKEFQKNKTKRLQSYVREAKNQIRKIVREVKGTKDVSKLRKAEKHIASMGRKPLSASLEEQEGWDVPPDRLKEGDQVLVKSVGVKGLLLEDPKGKKKVRIQLGNLTTVADTKDVRGRTGKNAGAKPETESFTVQVQAEMSSKAKTSCDLRGMDSEEALSAMETFISQAMANNLSRVKIIHGHGTGTIKKLVRYYLETAGGCKSFAPAEQSDGGDGVTVVEL
ncbi:MAG: endonuclease MutS2 [Nitrospinaceae bacterium]